MPRIVQVVAIVNMDRNLLSKPDNIFCLGLIDSEESYWPIMEDVVQQLEELYQPHYAKTPRGIVQVVTRFVIHLADTPQRNEVCSMGSHNSIVFCTHCMTTRGDPNEAELRRYTYMLATTVTRRDEIQQEYGIKSNIVHGTYVENPFFRLNKLYGFDIYRDSPIDPFHVILIGILPSTVDLMN